MQNDEKEFSNISDDRVLSVWLGGGREGGERGSGGAMLGLELFVQVKKFRDIASNIKSKRQKWKIESN